MSNLEDKDLLKFNYTLWAHDNYSNNWDISGYDVIMKFNSINDFWKIFNNSSKLDVIKYSFFLMKEDIYPTWEHEANREGGVYSLRCDNLSQSIKTWTDLCVYLMCNIISSKQDDINGVSINVKTSNKNNKETNASLIKIWNSNLENDLIKNINKAILNNYQGLQMRYKSNEPEY
jgi:hypothetical protein